MKGKIGMLLGAVLSIVMYVLVPDNSNPMDVLNATIGFLVMVICFIIWSSVCTDEDSESAERNKYFKGIILSNYAVAVMINCVSALYGDIRFRVLIYIFYMAVFFSFAMMFWTFGMYLLRIVGEKSSQVKLYSLIYNIVTGIHLILILSTPITKLYFYIDEMGTIQYSRTYFLAGVYAAVMLILSCIWIAKNGKGRQGKSILFSCIFIWGIGAVVDSLAVLEDTVFFSTDMMLGLLSAVGILWIFCGIYSKQKPLFSATNSAYCGRRL